PENKFLTFPFDLNSRNGDFAMSYNRQPVAEDPMQIWGYYPGGRFRHPIASDYARRIEATVADLR
ncbi:hypothetical protein, partial [Escherichia coli]|uniref:hypothetical protein n=1 Tax=Escherichia coli TaxID=562 RepID=UPI0027E06042